MNIINPHIAGMCNHKHCVNIAQFNVCFALRVHDKHPPAISSPVFQVCADHNDVKWIDVYSERGWALICKGFTSIGRQAPTIKYSYLEITPITPNERQPGQNRNN